MQTQVDTQVVPVNPPKRRKKKKEKEKEKEKEKKKKKEEEEEKEKEKKKEKKKKKQKKKNKQKKKKEAHSGGALLFGSPFPVQMFRARFVWTSFRIQLGWSICVARSVALAHMLTRRMATTVVVCHRGSSEVPV